VRAGRVGESHNLRPGATLLVLAILVSAVVLVVHWPALYCRAQLLDDTQYLTDNPLVRRPSWHSAWRFFSEVRRPSTVQGYYQPLTMLSLMLNSACGVTPDNLVPFHATNLALHAINSVLVMLLMWSLFHNLWAAAIAALLFGVHPLTVEVIPWVSERKGVLSAMFGLLCLLAYTRYARHGGRGRYAAVAAFFTLGLLSKPTVMPVPLMLLALDAWPLRRLSWATVGEKLPLLALAGLSGWITMTSQAATAALTLPGEPRAPSVPLLVCHNIVFYLGQVLLPLQLAPHYALPRPFDWSHPAVLRGAIGCALLLAVVLASLRWTRALAAGCAIFLLGLAPTLGVIGFSSAVAGDKYVYFPAIGLLLVVTWALAALLRSRPVAASPRRPGSSATTPRGSSRPSLRALLVGATASTALVAEAAGTRAYLAHWRDTELLWRRVLRLAPDAVAGNMELSIELAKQGRLAEALPHAQRAADAAPGYAKAHYNLGLVLAHLGRIQEAAAAFQHAAGAAPGYADAHYNLAYAQLHLGRTDLALAACRAALEADAHHAAARHLLHELRTSGVGLTGDRAP
jgi:hypothetical protein